MACILRIRGRDLRPEAIASLVSVPLDTVVSRGDRVRAAVAGRVSEEGRVTIVTSNRDDDDLKGQIQETMTFLTDHLDDIRRAVAVPAVENAYLDFSVEALIGSRNNVLFQCVHLPRDLIELAGRLSLGIELSLYPTRGPDRKAGVKRG